MVDPTKIIIILDPNCISSLSLHEKVRRNMAAKLLYYCDIYTVELRKVFLDHNLSQLLLDVIVGLQHFSVRISNISLGKFARDDFNS